MKSLFAKPDTDSDEVYTNLVTSSHPVAQKTRDFLDNLWVEYEKYADVNFEKEIKIDFYSRYWEMYLTCLIIEKGYRPQCPKPGPDIQIKSSPKIWVEAIAPSPGQPHLPDSVPPVVYGKASDHPSDQIILRYRTAIREKYDNKYSHYKDCGIIDETDQYIIAVSSCKIEIASLHPTIPEIVKSVFPIGFQRLHINTSNGKVVDSDYQHRGSVEKSSGKSVTTDIFFNPEYKYLSGILYSSATPANNHNLSGVEFIFIHNPSAINKTPQNFFNFGSEYTAVVVGDNCELTKTKHF